MLTRKEIELLFIDKTISDIGVSDGLVWILFTDKSKVWIG